MNGFEKELRMALAQVEEHCLREYVLFVALGTRQDEVLYCIEVALLKTTEHLTYALSGKASLETVEKFRGCNQHLPACVIRFHVTDTPKDAVVARILSEIDKVIDLPTPQSIEKIEMRSRIIGLNNGRRSTLLPSNSETESQLRRLISEAEKHGCTEYVVFAIVGKNKPGEGAEVCFGITYGDDRITHALPEKGLLGPVRQFRRAYMDDPICVIRCHVKDVGENDVAVRVVEFVKEASSVPGPEIWALALTQTESGPQECLQKIPPVRHDFEATKQLVSLMGTEGAQANATVICPLLSKIGAVGDQWVSVVFWEQSSIKVQAVARVWEDGAYRTEMSLQSEGFGGYGPIMAELILETLTPKQRELATNHEDNQRLDLDFDSASVLIKTPYTFVFIPATLVLEAEQESLEA